MAPGNGKQSLGHVIAPSILSADFGSLGEQIAEAERAGADWIHIDVMDGHFVPNLTLGPVVVEACRRATTLPLDVHLMVEKPEDLLPAFAGAGADSLTVHIEACPHIHRTIQQIRSLDCGAGVALNPGTPASMVRPVLGLVDIMLVMTVNPGFGGQTFIEEVLPKVETLKAWIQDEGDETRIEVDGGISRETIASCFAAGARIFVAGSSVFRHSAGIEAGIQALRSSLPG